ncbi:hypothetical protein BJ165DRAFT_1534083 [Panaeolus papilionaceus]|nr:hypothetical protein BJ165DRAFT_1534083 [Panaeolus papilionaceus]
MTLEQGRKRKGGYGRMGDLVVGPRGSTTTFTSRSSRACLALGVVDNPGNVLVGGRWSIGWGDARTEMVDYLDVIVVEYWAGKRMECGLMDVENKEDDDVMKVGYERGVGSRSDGRFSEIFAQAMDLTPPGAPTLTLHAAFHGHLLALGVVDDPGKVVVGGGRSIGWGGLIPEMLSHLDAIEVGYGGRKKDGMLLQMDLDTMTTAA